MKIFISHATNDIKIVKSLVELLYAIGLNEDDMFCSSVPELGIPIKNDIYDYLQKLLDDSALYIIFILSDNYYDSVACLNEMGAVWIKKTEYISFLLPGFGYEQIKGAVNPRAIALSLDDDFNIIKHRLNEFREHLQELFSINTSISWTRWETIRDNFINSAQMEDLKISMDRSDSFCIGDLSNDGCIIKDKDKDKIIAQIDFSQTTSKLSSIVIFPKRTNWRVFARKRKKLCFDVEMSDNISKLQVELHMPAAGRNFKYDAHRGHNSISLLEINPEINEFEIVREVCFLFEKRNVPSLENIIIKNLHIE